VSAALPLDGAPPVWAPDGKSILVFTGSAAGRQGAIALSVTVATAQGSIDIVKPAWPPCSDERETAPRRH